MFRVISILEAPAVSHSFFWLLPTLTEGRIYFKFHFSHARIIHTFYRLGPIYGSVGWTRELRVIRAQRICGSVNIFYKNIKYTTLSHNFLKEPFNLNIDFICISSCLARPSLFTFAWQTSQRSNADISLKNICLWKERKKHLISCVGLSQLIYTKTTDYVCVERLFRPK